MFIVFRQFSWDVIHDLNYLLFLDFYRLSTLAPALSKETLNYIWKALDPKNIGMISITELHELLASKFGKDKTTAKASGGVIERAIAKILERSGQTGGSKGLQR